MPPPFLPPSGTLGKLPPDVPDVYHIQTHPCLGGLREVLGSPERGFVVLQYKRVGHIRCDLPHLARRTELRRTVGVVRSALARVMPARRAAPAAAPAAEQQDAPDDDDEGAPGSDPTGVTGEGSDGGDGGDGGRGGRRGRGGHTAASQSRGPRVTQRRRVTGVTVGVSGHVLTSGHTRGSQRLTGPT